MHQLHAVWHDVDEAIYFTLGSNAHLLEDVGRLAPVTGAAACAKLSCSQIINACGEGGRTL